MVTSLSLKMMPVYDSHFNQYAVEDPKAALEDLYTAPEDVRSASKTPKLFGIFCMYKPTVLCKCSASSKTLSDSLKKPFNSLSEAAPQTHVQKNIPKAGIILRYVPYPVGTSATCHGVHVIWSMSGMQHTLCLPDVVHN